MTAYNVSAQKTSAVRKNVRGMNAPITNNATIIPIGFSSGIVGDGQDGATRRKRVKGAVRRQGEARPLTLREPTRLLSG